MANSTKAERDAQNKKLFIAGVQLRDWRERSDLSDAEFLEVMHALGWEHLTAGYQQRQAARVTSERKAAAVRENGKKGGRPRKNSTPDK